MAKKKKKINTSNPWSKNGPRFSPKALMEFRLKERELKLSSHEYCKNPYKDLDYSPFIYFQILEALQKKLLPQMHPVKVKEKNISDSSNYISYNPCVIYPIYVRNELYLILETNDENKATYGFHVRQSCANQIIKFLSDYFSSDKPNKRSTFPKIVNSINGIITFKRFAHTSSKIWEQRIMEFIKL